MIRAVVFDVGETILDDTELFGRWADSLSVPRHTFSALIGQIRACGGKTNDVFELLRPGSTMDELLEQRTLSGDSYEVTRSDIYPDVFDSLRMLRRMGLKTVVCGNQGSITESALRSLGLPADAIASSSSLGFKKPDAGYYQALSALCGFPPHEILHVGDNYDNDIVAARYCGMSTAYIKRGPWALFRASVTDEPCVAQYEISSLAELARIIEMDREVVSLPDPNLEIR